MDRNSLVQYCDNVLNTKIIKDYCPNGLQVEGTENISKIATAVTADENSIQKTIEIGAECLLVHHGYFWKGEDACVTGMKRNRLKFLLENNINLLAYHLPLDLHEQYGNNIQLARVLGFKVATKLDAPDIEGLGLIAEIDMSAEKVSQLLENKLSRKPLHIASQSNQQIKKIAWVTGAAQDYIETAKLAGCDAFISGEVSERTYYQAKECDIHYFAAGHHATERYGVQALGEHLAQEFALEYVFIDADNLI